MATKCTKWSQKIFLKFHPNAFKKLPKLGDLVWKRTIWHPCFRLFWTLKLSVKTQHWYVGARNPTEHICAAKIKKSSKTKIKVKTGVPLTCGGHFPVWSAPHLGLCFCLCSTHWPSAKYAPKHRRPDQVISSLKKKRKFISEVDAMDHFSKLLVDNT
jgi:hypothetical protein